MSMIFEFASDKSWSALDLLALSEKHGKTTEQMLNECIKEGLEVLKKEDEENDRE